MTDLLEHLIRGFNIFVLGYFIVLQLTYTALAAFGWRTVEDYVKRRPMRDYEAVGRSEMSMPVSILVPAYNEAPTIVSSVNALLRSQFLELEVVTINDGSTDSTLEALIEAFELVRVDRVPRSRIPTAGIRAVYVCPTDPRVVVIDKENAGKADSLNAGIKYATYPLFCAVDADTMLDAGALSRLVWEFQASPETVAVGGIVRIVNGSTFDNGRLDQVKTPTNLLANLQILEYLRAFLGGRIGWSKTGMLLIVSGAFGLFRRDVVVEVGGYDPAMVGEDAELILRLHRHHRELSRPCRITFFPDPICWTECPEDLRSLVRQRDRWQRGLIGMVMRHKDMIGRPRYGRIGLGAMPYYVVFELLGPTIECSGLRGVRGRPQPRLALGSLRPGVHRALAELRPGAHLPGHPHGGTRLQALPQLARSRPAGAVLGDRELRLPPAAVAGAPALLVHGHPRPSLGRDDPQGLRSVAAGRRCSGPAGAGRARWG